MYICKYQVEGAIFVFCRAKFPAANHRFLKQKKKNGCNSFLLEAIYWNQSSQTLSLIFCSIKVIVDDLNQINPNNASVGTLPQPLIEVRLKTFTSYLYKMGGVKLKLLIMNKVTSWQTWDDRL